MSLEVNNLLEQNRQSDMLRFTTAGSVDDGKSTLIGRLLNDCKCIYEDHLEAVGRDSNKLGREEVDWALLTDGLQAEREQGITIDVAYRFFSTPKRRFIVADTPGHEQYTRNMATGASTADLAIVLIDARNGVLTQSKRHGFIASLLNISHVIVAVNKMDLVDYSQERFEEIREEYAEFAAKLNFTDMTFIPISALKGDNVASASDVMDWYSGPTLLGHLENVYIGGDRNLVDFRFPVQYVNRPNLNFRGYCGTVASGIVRVGDEVQVLPSRKTTKVAEIVFGNKKLDYAFPPQSVTLTLEDEIDISRGDVIVHVNNQPKVARKIEAMLVWMNEQPLQVGKTYQIKHTTNTIRGQFHTLNYKVDPNTLHRHDADELHLNEIGRVRLDLFGDLCFDEYRKNKTTGAFIVIDALTNATVGAGMVIDRVAGDATRPMLSSPDTISKNISPHRGIVGPEERAELLGQTPKTIWLTGLSGSGKSTLAYEVERQLIDQGRACCVLDGDNIRFGLNRDLGFSPDDRKENIRRVAEIAKLMNQAGLIVITAFISPYLVDREKARKIIGEPFTEVHLSTPLEVCETRDPKGLYKKARNKEIQEFTGVSAPYEAPLEPEYSYDTAEAEPAEIAKALLSALCV